MLFYDCVWKESFRLFWEIIIFIDIPNQHYENNMLYIFIQLISKYWQRKTDMNIITQIVIIVEEENEITSFPRCMCPSVFSCSLSLSLSSLSFFNTVADINSSSEFFTLMTLYAMTLCSSPLKYFIELIPETVVMGKFMKLNEWVHFRHIVYNFDIVILNSKW